MLHNGDLLSEPQTKQPIEQGGAAVLECPNCYCPARCACCFSSTAVRIVLVLLCNIWHHLLPDQQLPITLHDLTNKLPSQYGKTLICSLNLRVQTLIRRTDPVGYTRHITRLCLTELHSRCLPNSVRFTIQNSSCRSKLCG